MRRNYLSICSFCIPDKLTAGGKCFVLHTRSAHEFCGWHRDAVHRAEDDPDDHLSGGITVKVCTAAHLAPFFANEVIIRWIVRGGVHERTRVEVLGAAFPVSAVRFHSRLPVIPASYVPPKNTASPDCNQIVTVACQKGPVDFG